MWGIGLASLGGCATEAQPGALGNEDEAPLNGSGSPSDSTGSGDTPTTNTSGTGGAIGTVTDPGVNPTGTPSTDPGVDPDPGTNTDPDPGTGTNDQTICGRADSCQMPGTRDAAYWPFDTCSSWNHPIGEDAEYEQIAFQPTSEAWKKYIGWAENPSWNDFGCLGPRTDNLVIVEDAEPSYPGTISGSGQTYSFNIPNNMEMPPASDDGHIYFVKADRSEAYETYLSAWNGSNISAAWVVKNYSLSDSGNMPDGDEWTYRGTRAFGGSAMAGVIRAGELIHGIRHAITLKAPQQALNKNGPNGNCWTWPATACDGDYSNYNEGGNLYMGSLVAIPPNADLSFITNPKIMNIAIALRDYGGYITDRGGELSYDGFPSCWQYMTEYQIEEMKDIDTQYEQLGKIAGLLEVVVNNRPDNVGGGGKPRACFAPDL